MRGEERRQRAILMIMEPGDRVPKEHPLRRVKELADAALTQLSPLFDEMYNEIGRRISDSHGTNTAGVRGPNAPSRSRIR